MGHHAGATRQKSWTGRCLVSVLCLFLVSHVSVEDALPGYLTTFAVESDLRLSRVQGAKLTTVYLAAYAAMRLLAVLAAARYIRTKSTSVSRVFFTPIRSFLYRLSPLSMMFFNLVASLASTGILALYAQSSAELLFACVAVAGFGVASIYATVVVWAEQHVEVTGRIMSAFAVATTIGTKVIRLI